jgi:uncharacterized protein (DUF4213/DUF364 family)
MAKVYDMILEYEKLDKDIEMACIVKQMNKEVQTLKNRVSVLEMRSEVL